MTTDEKAILGEIRNFYDTLYTTQGKIDVTFLEDLNIPRISEELKQELEQPITIIELAQALKELKNDKCLGTDSLDASFYKVFWPQVKEKLLDIYNEAIQKGMLHLSARQSVISLSEKPGKDPLKLKCWRPLSLLNTDNKIYSKLLAKRLQKVTEIVVHNSQQGFIKGRVLSENILKIQAIMEKCKQLDSLLISFDFEKAFDCLEFESMFVALKAFNIGDRFIQMVKTLLQSPIAYVGNNGFWSAPIFLTRACRQGCCFSLAIFVLTVELLGLAIRQKDFIEGIEINGKIVKSGQFADDLWTFTPARVRDVNSILKLLPKFRKFSGLRINSEKCVVLWVGPHKDSDAKFYTLKKLFWLDGPVKILGFWIHPDKNIMFQHNFMQLLNEVDMVIHKWKECNISLIGKVIIINSLINSKFIHRLAALPTPPCEFYSTYKKKIQDFLWEEKPARI